MSAAQRARDATLGESVLEGAKDGRAVLIAGAGHVRTDRGAGAWLAQRRPDKRLVAIAFVEVEDGSDAPADYAARFHADTLPFDYVWFTPRASNDDPCAAMKPKERTSSESPPGGAGATGIRSVDLPRLAFEAAYAPGAFPFPEEQSRRRDAIAEQALWNDGGRGSVKWHPQPRVVIGEPSVGGGRAPEKGKKKASPPRWDTIGAMRALRRFGYVGVRRCFDAALRGEGGLEGRTVVDIGVDGKGRIVSAQPSNGRVQDSRKHQTRLVPPTVRTCIADALRRVAVPPAAGKRVLARVSVDVWPGDAELPVPEPAPLPGSLPPTAFSEAIAAASPALRGCFEALGKQRPDTWGRLALRLDALPDGTLSASQVGSTFPDAEVVACAASALSNVRAPVHATASRAMVAWRFHPPVESEPPRARSGETDAGAVDAASSDADLR